MTVSTRVHTRRRDMKVEFDSEFPGSRTQPLGRGLRIVGDLGGTARVVDRHAAITTPPPASDSQAQMTVGERGVIRQLSGSRSSGMCFLKKEASYPVR